MYSAVLSRNIEYIPDSRRIRYRFLMPEHRQKRLGRGIRRPHAGSSVGASAGRSRGSRESESLTWCFECYIEDVGVESGYTPVILRSKVGYDTEDREFRVSNRQIQQVG
jgi:hypothetical protein